MLNVGLLDQAVPTKRSIRRATDFYGDFQLLNDINGWKIKGFRKIAVYGGNGGLQRQRTQNVDLTTFSVLETTYFQNTPIVHAHVSL